MLRSNPCWISLLPLRRLAGLWDGIVPPFRKKYASICFSRKPAALDALSMTVPTGVTVLSPDSVPIQPAAFKNVAFVPNATCIVRIISRNSVPPYPALPMSATAVPRETSVLLKNISIPHRLPKGSMRLSVPNPVPVSASPKTKLCSLTLFSPL